MWNFNQKNICSVYTNTFDTSFWYLLSCLSVWAKINWLLKIFSINLSIMVMSWFSFSKNSIFNKNRDTVIQCWTEGENCDYRPTLRLLQTLDYWVASPHCYFTRVLPHKKGNTCASFHKESVGFYSNLTAKWEKNICHFLNHHNRMDSVVSKKLTTVIG